MHELATHVAHGAFHDSSVRYPPPKCHPGTREKVLTRIKDWIATGEGTSRILWLYGSAGVGKSAIAQTIAEHCLTNDKLDAAFFFFRGDPQRNDANLLFPTLAWQLMFSVPEIKAHLSAFMEKDPFIPIRFLETQFEQLIAEPFRLAAKNNPPLRTSGIVIIDGVDECAGETMQQCFLSLLGRAVDNGGLPLRFLICSRPESHIRETFDHSISASVTSRIGLNDDVDSDDDIRRYLVQEFSRISTEMGIASHTWPPEGVLDRLVQNSSGQFIYAATVVKFVGDKYAYPGNQLEIIFGIRRATNSSSPFADLDQLYLEILVRQPDQDFLKTFLNFLCLPIDHRVDRVELIRILLDMKKEEFLAKIRGLHSLLDISDVSCNIEAHPYHASFFEFLRNQGRSCQYHSDKVLGSRDFVDLFLKALIKYASSIQQPRYVLCQSYAPISILFSLIPYKHDFNVILLHGISSSKSILDCIAVNQWEQMLAPLRILRDLEFEMPSSGSVQPFKTVHWSLRLLFLSLRGELFNRRRTNSLISLVHLAIVVSRCPKCS
jgi:hypothetical protein